MRKIMSDLKFTFDEARFEGLSGSELMGEKLDQVVEKEDLDTSDKIYALLMLVADLVTVPPYAPDHPKLAKWASDVLPIVLKSVMQRPITETHLH
jgi:hypothetical protein